MAESRHRYVAQYRVDRADRDSGAASGSARTAGDRRAGRRRLVATTAVFAPVLAVAALPVTALVAFIAFPVGRATSMWLAGLLMVGLAVAAAVAVARSALGHQGANRARWWRPLIPILASAGVIGAAMVEMISGSRAPDPILALWFFATWWCAMFYVRAGRPWPVWQRVLWVATPVVTAVAIVFVLSSGFFSWRFERAVADLDAYVERLGEGERFEPRITFEGFTLLSRGQLGGCDAAFQMTGWHADDDRWIARCPNGAPDRDDVQQLSGNWYEYRID